jgi:hypothetical protein
MKKQTGTKKELKSARVLVLHTETLRWMNGGGGLHLPVGVAGDTNLTNCAC